MKKKHLKGRQKRLLMGIKVDSATRVNRHSPVIMLCVSVCMCVTETETGTKS